jgi:hypothetical protein
VFPGTGTGPSQSVGEDPEFGRELLTMMLVSESAPVFVTTTRHQTSVPLTVADEAQSGPLIGWVGSQEGPTGNVHTCATAEIESVAADAGVGDHASSASKGNKSPPARESRKRGAASPVILILHLGRRRTAAI